MRKTATVIIGVGVLAVVATIWAYVAPTPMQTVNDRLLTNAEQTVELQATTIDGKPNPNFVKYRNASCGLWLKNGDNFRILAEVNGEVLSVPLAEGSAACSVGLRQPIYVRVRIEEPTVEPAPETVELEP